MNKKSPAPGVSRDERISDEGLQRLERQLLRGSQLSSPVLAQWIKRYGEPAREIIRHHGQYTAELDAD